MLIFLHLRAKKADALRNTSLLEVPTPVPSISVTPATSLPSSPAPSVPPSVATCDAQAPPNTPIINNHQPPPLELVKHAIPILEAVVNPKRPSGSGHLQPKLNPLAVKDLRSVLELFQIYTAKDITWQQASINVSNAKGHGKGHAESLRAWGFRRP
ncbi:hypothetical protein FRC07_007481 [Ceratobasidium sp. 392]|nr:hypothetical protein FRC07_007481 [Ceratobasidium sp. 392]